MDSNESIKSTTGEIFYKSLNFDVLKNSQFDNNKNETQQNRTFTTFMLFCKWTVAEEKCAVNPVELVIKVVTYNVYSVYALFCSQGFPDHHTPLENYNIP